MILVILESSRSHDTQNIKSVNPENIKFYPPDRLSNIYDLLNCRVVILVILASFVDLNIVTFVSFDHQIKLFDIIKK
jgi:hypothetical protein